MPWHKRGKQTCLQILNQQLNTKSPIYHMSFHFVSNRLRTCTHVSPDYVNRHVKHNNHQLNVGLCESTIAMPRLKIKIKCSTWSSEIFVISSSWVGSSRTWLYFLLHHGRLFEATQTWRGIIAEVNFSIVIHLCCGWRRIWILADQPARMNKNTNKKNKLMCKGLGMVVPEKKPITVPTCPVASPGSAEESVSLLWEILNQQKHWSRNHEAIIRNLK